MHLGLLGDLLERSQRLGITGVLAAQFLDASFHGRVQVFPPVFVRQREVIHEGEVARLAPSV